MPAIIPIDFPAARLLVAEGQQQPLATGTVKADSTIGFINLMPNKIDTEMDFLRLINPLHHNVEFLPIKMLSHTSRHADPAHLDRFYHSFDSVADQLDGIIITGAPLDTVPFEEVTYWNEITSIMDQCHQRRLPMYNLCWGAFASLYHWWGIGMHYNPVKLSGVFPCEIVMPQSPIVRGLQSGFEVPFSRFVGWRDSEINGNPDLQVIARGDRQGAYIVASRTHPEYYITGHAEYSRLTLHNEFTRDLNKGINPSLPENYYPDNDPAKQPEHRWAETALTIMSNWINETIRLKETRLL